jgi:hypothetical protein
LRSIVKEVISGRNSMKDRKRKWAAYDSLSKRWQEAQTWQRQQRTLLSPCV